MHAPNIFLIVSRSDHADFHVGDADRLSKLPDFLDVFCARVFLMLLPVVPLTRVGSVTVFLAQIVECPVRVLIPLDRERDLLGGTMNPFSKSSLVVTRTPSARALAALAEPTPLLPETTSTSVLPDTAFVTRPPLSSTFFCRAASRKPVNTTVVFFMLVCLLTVIPRRQFAFLCMYFLCIFLCNTTNNQTYRPYCRCG